MKKTSTLLVIMLAVLAIGFTACSRTSEPSDKSTTAAVDTRTYWEKYRDDAIATYSYPYVSIIAFDKETKAELDAIPERLKVYQETFDLTIEDIKNPNEKTEMFLTAAVSDDKYVRDEVASNDECPVEILAKIAKDEPDMVVRCSALGNLLARDDLPVEFVEKMATSPYYTTRIMALLHPCVTYEIITMLTDDPDPRVRDEVRRLIAKA